MHWRRLTHLEPDRLSGGELHRYEAVIEGRRRFGSDLRERDHVRGHERSCLREYDAILEALEQRQQEPARAL